MRHLDGLHDLLVQHVPQVLPVDQCGSSGDRLLWCIVDWAAVDAPSVLQGADRVYSLSAHSDRLGTLLSRRYLIDRGLW